MTQKLAINITKVNPKAKVDVSETSIEVYSTVSKVLPLFNNMGNEIEISNELTNNIIKIPTGIKIENTKELANYIPKFILSQILANNSIICYNSQIEDGELTLLLQNLGNKKVNVMQNTKVGKIVFLPIVNISAKIKQTK